MEIQLAPPVPKPPLCRQSANISRVPSCPQSARRKSATAIKPSKDTAEQAETSHRQQLPLPLPNYAKSCRKLVFLDVDGVLHEANFAKQAFRSDCMDALALLWRATSAEIILSSTWKETAVGRQAVDKALKRKRIPAVSGFTENSHTSRGACIQDWVNKNCKAGATLRWIALDDMDMTRELGDHMVCTNPRIGLTHRDAQRAIAILNDRPFTNDSNSEDSEWSYEPESDCSSILSTSYSSRSSSCGSPASQAPGGPLCIEIIEKICVVPWGVLGSNCKERTASLPDDQTVFVDSAGLHHIHGEQGPRGASGAAREVYKWLGINKSMSFPEDVKKHVQKTTDARFYMYGRKKVIHVASPNLRDAKYCGNRAAAVKDLSKAYENCLCEFFRCALRCLRLIPLSAGSFCGNFVQEMPKLTRDALVGGFNALNAQQKRCVLQAFSVELCIFSQDDYEEYLNAFSADQSSDDDDISSRVSLVNMARLIKHVRARVANLLDIGSQSTTPFLPACQPCLLPSTASVPSSNDGSIRCALRIAVCPKSQ